MRRRGAILERDDVIIVASVSCIYGIGAVETYSGMAFSIARGARIPRADLLARLVALQYRRNDDAFARGAFACAATPSTSSRPITRTAPGA